MMWKGCRANYPQRIKCGTRSGVIEGSLVERRHEAFGIVVMVKEMSRIIQP